MRLLYLILVHYFIALVSIHPKQLFMKNIPFICFLVFTGLFQHVKAQSADPYERIKKLAESTPVQQDTSTRNIVITTQNPFYKVNARMPIPYIPFELKNNAGLPIDPESMISLPSGKRITMREYIEKLNNFEKQLNEIGYSLRNDSSIVISRMITDNKFKEQRVQHFPFSVYPRKNDSDLDAYKTINSSDDIVFKPYIPATGRDDILKGNTKKNEGISGIQTKKDVVLTRKATPNYSNTLLSTIDEENPFIYELGDPSIISGGLSFNLKRHAKIYSPNLAALSQNRSELNLEATANITGSLFGYNFNLIEVKASLDAPADLSKKKMLVFNVKAVGKTFVDVNPSFTGSTGSISYKESFALSVDQSAGITIPIFGPLNFVGKIGFSGNVGVEYEFKATGIPDISASVKPVAEVKVYAEVGVGLGDMFVIGVGGHLTLIKTDVDLVGSIGIGNLYNPTINKFPLIYKISMGLDLTLLSGDFYVFGRLCTPSLWGLLPQACYEYTHNIYTWDGYRISTNLVQQSIKSPLTKESH